MVTVMLYFSHQPGPVDPKSFVTPLGQSRKEFTLLLWQSSHLGRPEGSAHIK